MPSTDSYPGPAVRPLIRLALLPACVLAAPAAADEPTRLDEVVVTAPSTAAPLTVVTDPKAPRQPVPPADGAGYLKNIPGFSVVRKGGSGGDPVLRGLGGSRLQVMLDDTPLLGGCGGRMDPPTAYVFPESYDSITVVKGPQTVAYGPGNLAGTVLFERSTPRFDELGVRGIASGVLGSYGRNDQLLDIAAGAKTGYVRAIGTRAEADDYEDGSGNEVRSSYLRQSVTGILGWTPDDATVIEASVDLSEAEAAYADRVMDGVVFDRQSVKLEATREALSPVVSRINAQAYYHYIDHVMDNFTLRPNTGMRMLNNPDRETIGGRATVDLAVAGSTVLTLGASYNRDEHTLRNLNNAEYLAGVSYETKPRLPDMTFETIGLFAELEHLTSPDGRLLLGLRGDVVEVENEKTGSRAEDEDDLLNAFARYEHQLGGGPATGYVAFGHAERTPDWWERNRVFALAPERSNQIDVGLVHQGERLQGSLSVFHAWIDDFILIQSTAPTARNIDATLVGGEADIAYALTATWSVRATAAYVRGDNQTDDRPLAQIAPLEGTAHLRYDDGSFFGGVLMRAVAEQDRVDPGKGTIAGTDIAPTSGFTVWSANLGWRPREGMTLAAGVDNIFDKTYAEHLSKGVHASVAALGYEQTTRVNEPGRTFWLKGSLRF